MKRKHNPWVSLVALLLLVTLLVYICTGCTEAEAEEPGRFTVESTQREFGVDFLVITDNETGVQYLMADVYNGAGLTVLQPAPTEEG